MLYQQYRPQTWSEYVGQPKAVAKVRQIIERSGFDRGAFWIECAGSNNSGTGKTSLAWLIAESLADRFFIEELQGAKVTKATVDGMEQAARLCTWGEPSKPYRAWIINESHAMTQGAVDVLLTFLEALPRHCVVIFTTTRSVDADLFGDKDSGAFASRCHQVRLTNQGLTQPFAERARSIAQAEGLDGQPIEAYVKLVKDCKNNLRAAIARIEAGEMLAER